MKKLSIALMMTATVLGLAVATTTAMTVRADAGQLNTATNGKASDTNTAKLNVQAGELSFTTPAGVDFGSANVGTVYTSGQQLTATAGSSTIKDFLGDNGNWTLSVSQSGWSGKKDTAATALNTAATLSVDGSGTSSNGAKGSLATFKSGDIEQAQPVVTGGAGQTDATFAYGLDLAAGNNLTVDDYTNTLTWSLNNVPANAE